MNRQSYRRGLLHDALTKMPAFETWTTSQHVDTGFYIQGERIIKEVKQAHCKTIPRHVRRSMACDLAKRTFNAFRSS